MKKYIKLIIVFLVITLITLVGTIVIGFLDHSKIISNEGVNLVVNSMGVQVPTPIPRAIANYHFSQWFFLIRTIVSFSVPFIFYKIGFVDGFKEGKNKIISLISFVAMFLVVDFILTVPISYLSSYYRLKLVGLSNMTLISWIENIVKDFLINSLIVLIISPIIYLIFKKFKKWYIILSILYIPISIFFVAIYPIYIEPLYNEYKPLRSEIREPVEKLLQKANVDKVNLYEVDKSKETSALNAYMSGVHNSKRIVIWDTTITQLEEKEVMSVVAHEIGHYTLNHIPKGIILSSIIVFISLFISNFIYNLIIKKGIIKNIRSKEVASLPILIFILGIVGVLMTPIENYSSRKMEVEADKFAIELTEDNLTNGVLEVRFMETNLSMDDVNPIFKWFVFTHPSAKERIQLSNTYKPWENGEWEFEKYIKR